MKHAFKNHHVMDSNIIFKSQVNPVICTHRRVAIVEFNYIYVHEDVRL